MTKKVVCHLTSVHPRYDTRIFKKMCCTLSNFFDVHLIVADGKGSEIIDNVNISDVGNMGSSRVKRMVLTSCRVLINAIKVKAEVYHFHDPELIPVGLLLKVAGKKVIYDVHEDIPQQILRKHWIPSILKRPISFVTKLVEHFSVFFFDGVVSVTPKIVKRFPINKTIEVRNYPLLEEFSTFQNAEVIERKDIVYIGAISENRGIFQMVDSLEGSDYNLVIGGTFVNKKLEQKIQSLEGWKNVDFKGWVERDEVSTILKKSSIGLVVLQPTGDYEDAYPVKLFEYMAAGLAVISSDFPLWRQIIDDDNCGLCVDPTSADDISIAINILKKDPELAKKMGQNGQKAVFNKYSWANEGDKLINFYNCLFYVSKK